MAVMRERSDSTILKMNLYVITTHVLVTQKQALLDRICVHNFQRLLCFENTSMNRFIVYCYKEPDSPL